ncbi:FAD:protein FMN transferase [Solimonas marina]|uniref:FAD:protein FMN transferase n=1 Tax=Solimonas marina TaxID=2714601 RepID=A0A970B726_9GAMM|nr:FAD:protein FMN transferase [Solimonas marina]NKF23438.1 FAD:protein FMN transferase [Solimonas marina]
MGWLRRPTPLQRRFMAMGTFVTATVIVEPRGRVAADSALAVVESELLSFGHDAWAWGAGSLATFNRRLAAGQRAEIPKHLKPLFDRAWNIHRLSGGRFEPRIASLVRLWGFDDMTRLRDEPPPQIEIDALFASLRIAPDYDGSDHYGPARNVGWDFGGIGKGYIVDRALTSLKRMGYENASIDAGGNLAVRGVRNERPWRVGIRDPRESAIPRLLATLDATDEAVITHGDDQRYFEYGGKRYSHLLDPRTGWPVQGLRSLTVVHPDAAIADAAGGALFVAGPQAWRELAARMKIDQVLVLTEHDELIATPALAARLRPQDGSQLRIAA